MKYQTIAIHGGRKDDSGKGAVNYPLYLSSTFEQDNMTEFKEFVYSRGASNSANAVSGAEAPATRGLEVLDEDGNRFVLPNGAEWEEAESDLQSMEVAWGPDGSVYSALVGYIRFYCTDGHAYHIYICCDEMQNPDPYDPSYIYHLNNYSGNTIVLAKSAYQTVDTIFPGGCSVDVATRDCYYIANGEILEFGMAN